MPRICHHKSGFKNFIGLIQYHQSCSRTPLDSHNRCFFFFFIQKFRRNVAKEKREKLIKFAQKKQNKHPKFFLISFSKNSEISPGKKKKKTLVITLPNAQTVGLISVTTLPEFWFAMLAIVHNRTCFVLCKE
jgi:hypothetical protein